MFAKYSLAFISEDYRRLAPQVQPARLPMSSGMRSSRTSDLFLAGTLRTIVLGLISIAAATSVLLAYQSLLQLIAGNLAMLAAKIF
jgi:hypothetical protein